MARPLTRNNVPSRVHANRTGIRTEQRKPFFPGLWVYVGDFDAGDPGTTIESPEWLNGWNSFETNYVAFRHGLDGDVQFKGILDTTGMTSGTTAFRLPAEWRPNGGFSFLTDMDVGGDEFSAARIAVAADGYVTVYFPITVA